MTEDPAETVGLCFRCGYARIVHGKRSRFWFCERSRSDPRFVRYPRLPVLECSGYEAGPSAPSVRTDADAPR